MSQSASSVSLILLLLVNIFYLFPKIKVKNNPVSTNILRTQLPAFDIASQFWDPQDLHVRSMQVEV